MTGSVAVVGAGPAGIAAAVRASECGRDVLLLDDNPDCGGQIWRGRNSHGRQWFERLERSGAKTLTGARVFAGDARRRVLDVETESGAFEVRYEKLILATGARELFLPFPGWTLPDVTGAGGLQALVKSGLPIEGKRVVVAGSGPLLLAVAAYLRGRGAIVPAIVEQADGALVARFGAALAAHPMKLGQAIRLRASVAGSAYWTGAWVERADGMGRVSEVRIRFADGRKRAVNVACDYLAIGYGLRPNTELARHLGATGVDDLQRSSIERIYCAGEAAGIGGVDLALIEGQIAGYAAGGRPELARRLFAAREKARRFAGALNQTFAPRAELRELADAETIVCRCEDVRFRQLRTADGWLSAKLHSRCGMGPCQGRVCGPAVEFLFGWQAESIRPPVSAVRVGSLITGGATK